MDKENDLLTNFGTDLFTKDQKKTHQCPKLTKSIPVRNLRKTAKTDKNYLRNSSLNIHRISGIF